MGFLGDLFKGIGGAVPVAGPLISGLLGAFQGREENQANTQAADLFNQFYGPGGTRAQGAEDLLARFPGMAGPQQYSSSGTSICAWTVFIVAPLGLH